MSQVRSNDGDYVSLKNLLFRVCVLLLSLSLLSPRKAKSAFENEEDEIGVFGKISLQKKKEANKRVAIYISLVCLSFKNIINTNK